MTKQTGMGMNYYVGGYDLSGQTNSLGTIHGGPNNTQDSTDITQLAIARLGLERDGGVTWVSYFDPVGASHVVLSALPTTDNICQVHVPPLAIGSPTFAVNSKLIGYDPTRAQDGSITLAASAVANGFGGEWGVALTPGHRVDGSATVASSGNSFDTGGSLAFGAQMYVQLFAFSGTSVTFTLWDSADNSTFASTGLATAALSAASQAVRVAVSNTTTIRRYIAIATTGTFSNADFAVMVNKNPVAGVVF
jgi:hypothetical protein